MYEKDEETGKVDFSHNPFSMPQGGLEALETQDPLDVLGWQYDIVCNGIELSSGAIRNHEPDIMFKAFEIAGYSRETVETEFAGMLRAFQFGARRTAASPRAWTASSCSSRTSPTSARPSPSPSTATPRTS